MNDDKHPLSGEKRIISLLLSGNPPPGEDLIIGPGEDDCAVLDIGDGRCLVMTTDMLHSKTDFPQGMSLFQIGWTCVAVSLSDIASMGAEPWAITVAAGLPSAMGEDEIVELGKGITECARTYNVAMVGGDVDEHDELTLVSAAIGKVDKNRLITRAGAKVGDAVCVTGFLGSAAAGLKIIKENIETPADVKQVLTDALFQPQPRVNEARKLAEMGCVTSMIDISDGLAASLYELSHASGVGFTIEADKLPIRDETQQVSASPEETLELALYCGGDYELLFTMAPEHVKDVQEAVDITVIGSVTSKEGGIHLMVNDEDGMIEGRGYSHFG